MARDSAPQGTTKNRDQGTAAPSRRGGKRWGLVLRVLMTVVLAGVLVYYVPMGKLVDALRTANWWLVGAAVIAGQMADLIYTLRWHVVLTGLGYSRSAWQTIRLGFIGRFYNNFFPSAVGGDVAKGWYLVAESELTAAEVTASIVVDRVVGTAVVLLLAALGTWHLGLHSLMLALLGLILLGGVTLLVARSMRLLRLRDGCGATGTRTGRLLCLIRRRSQSLVAAIRAGGHDTARISCVVLLSICGCILNGTALLFRCAALGFSLGLIDAVSITTVIKGASMVPVSINGLGVSEGLHVLLLGQLGMATGGALGQALIARVDMLLTSLLGGALQFTGRAHFESAPPQDAEADRTVTADVPARQRSR